MNSVEDPSANGVELSDQQILAQKINKLLTVLSARNGAPPTFHEVREALAEHGVSLTRTRWHRLRSGSSMNKWDPDLVIALAHYFDVNELYLLERDGPISDQVEAELNLLSALKISKAKDVSARTVGDLTPEALNELAETIKRLRANKG